MNLVFLWARAVPCPLGEFLCLLAHGFCFRCCFVLAFSSACPAQSKTAAAVPVMVKPKIRTITAFINLDPAQYRSQVADTLQMLRRAKTIFESRGYEVETIRIATQPFPEYTKGMTAKEAIAFFKEYDALSEKEKFAPGIGPAMLNADDPESQADLLAEILANTKHIRGSIVIAGEDGIRWRAIGAAARAIKKLEDTTEHSQGNFNLGATADVKPLSPFFTAAYHTGFGHQFAIGLESANVVTEAFRDSTDIDAARKKLTDMLTTHAMEIERHAMRIDRETGWAYVGIDLSPAPLKDVFHRRRHRKSYRSAIRLGWHSHRSRHHHSGNQRHSRKTNRLRRPHAPHS